MKSTSRNITSARSGRMLLKTEDNFLVWRQALADLCSEKLRGLSIEDFNARVIRSWYVEGKTPSRAFDLLLESAEQDSGIEIAVLASSNRGERI